MLRIVVARSYGTAHQRARTLVRSRSKTVAVAKYALVVPRNALGGHAAQNLCVPDQDDLRPAQNSATIAMKSSCEDFRRSSADLPAVKLSVSAYYTICCLSIGTNVVTGLYEDMLLCSTFRISDTAIAAM